MSSVIKVEKRRAQAIERINKMTSETAWLVDRYKFQDLLPCSATELRSIGYVVKHQHHNPFAPTVANVVSATIPSTLSTYPKPDFQQMVPFKPKTNPSKKYSQTIFAINKKYLKNTNESPSDKN